MLGISSYNNIDCIPLGRQKQDSLVLVPEARSILQSTDCVRVDAQEYTLAVEGQILFSFDEPSFEAYEVMGREAGQATIRQTVDGIKTTLTGGAEVRLRSSHHARITFQVGDGLLYGLGSHEEGYPYLNGHAFPMIQENMRIAVPVFVSTKGYAVLVDNTSFMNFDFQKEGICELYVDCADALDIYVLHGEMQDIYESLRFLTGTTPMLPKWSLGYIQSKERYVNQQELVDVVEEYRRRQVPLDGIVQDWLYWGDNLWGEKVLDTRRYPDFSVAINHIHEMGAHIMLSIWPNMSGGGQNQQEFQAAGLMLSDGSVYNAFSEAGRDMYWKQARDELFCHGLDAWWCDSSEPYDANWEGRERRTLEDGLARSIAEFKKYMDDGVINSYSLYHSMGIYEHQRKESNKRVLNLTRSGYAGQHRYGTVTWSGDISASWETLRKQVFILQNYIATGEAYWNSDIGGFFVKNGEPWFWSGAFDQGVEDSAYRELFVRWTQFAGFTPMMRAHGTDTPREIWRFGEPGTLYYDAIKAAIELRYQLLPYFYSVNAAVTREGRMPVQSLPLAFPNEKIADEFLLEYMYGDALLVCPVTVAGTEAMEVYLPKGIWYDFYSGKKYVGGRSYLVPVSLSGIPVYVKAGSIVPVAPVQQYVGELTNCPIEIRVYGGADGRFLLYEDAGDGYGYEQGEYSLVEISYKASTDEVSCRELGDAAYAHPMDIVMIK